MCTGEKGARIAVNSFAYMKTPAGRASGTPRRKIPSN